MKLIRVSILMAVVALITSCQMAKFDRVPGEELVNIPVELHGKFALALGENKAILGGDSIYLIIENSSFQVITQGATINKIHNQDFKTAKFKGKTLFALNDATIPSLWNMVIVENFKGNLRVYPLLDRRTNPEEAGKLGNYIPQQMLNINADPIAPPQQPIAESGGAPINSPNQGLPNRAFYFTMMEEQFEQYLTNEVIGKEFYQFNKVEVKAKKK